MLAEPTIKPQSDAVMSSVALAGIIFDPGRNIDNLLVRIAEGLKQKGCMVAGLVQEKAPRIEGSCCPTTFVHHLADGTRTKISVDRGANASGCRLDANALAVAAKRVEAALTSGAEVLIINRFGQSKSDGWGMRGTIELAIEHGIPVIVGVRRTYVLQWDEFHGDLATSLAFDKDVAIGGTPGIGPAPRLGTLTTTA
jgi:nucleoside-triphosphatase THEP1